MIDNPVSFCANYEPHLNKVSIGVNQAICSGVQTGGGLFSVSLPRHLGQWLVAICWIFRRPISYGCHSLSPDLWRLAGGSHSSDLVPLFFCASSPFPSELVCHSHVLYSRRHLFKATLAHLMASLSQTKDAAFDPPFLGQLWDSHMQCPGPDVVDYI